MLLGVSRLGSTERGHSLGVQLPYVPFFVVSAGPGETREMLFQLYPRLFLQVGKGGALPDVSFFAPLTALKMWVLVSLGV